MINGACQQCPPNTFFDGQKCVFGVNHCSKSNQIWNGNECICIENYYMMNGSCVTCPLWATWNGARCITKQTYNCKIN